MPRPGCFTPQERDPVQEGGWDLGPDCMVQKILPSQEFDPWTNEQEEMLNFMMFLDVF